MESHSRTLIFFLSVYTLWKRELVRFFRDRNRLFGAIGQPFIFWVLVGSGLSASFIPAGSIRGMSYLEYIYPGTLLLILLFTAIFSTISVIEDRREGFMQAVLVAPVIRTGLVLGKILGGTTIAFLEGTIFLIFFLWLDIPLTLLALLATLGLLFLIAFGLTGLGFAFAWYMESTAGFHAVMNLFLLPMWLLSGAFFPLVGLPAWLEYLVWVNPLTYAMGALRQALYLGVSFESNCLPSTSICLVITVLFSLLTFGISIILASRRERGVVL